MNGNPILASLLLVLVRCDELRDLRRFDESELLDRFEAPSPLDERLLEDSPLPDRRCSVGTLSTVVWLVGFWLGTVGAEGDAGV